MHTITLDGHQYSADHTAPRLVLLSALQAAQQRARFGEVPDHSTAHPFGTVLADQQRNLHRVTAGACSCGLVVVDVRELGGHRDLTTTAIADAFVMADHDGWWALACQACRVISVSGSEDAAHRRVRDHLCAWDVRDR